MSYQCARCGLMPRAPALHDYCALCSTTLCIGCMKRGCCGHQPALSGMADDQAADAEGDQE